MKNEERRMRREGCRIKNNIPQSVIRNPQSHASALIMVLWVIMILSIIIGSFAFNAHIEARITSYYRKRTKAEYLARSGITVAEMLMIRRGDAKTSGDEVSEHEEEWWFSSAKKLSEGLAVRGFVHELGGGTITLDIVPEPALRNVNKLTVEDWERMFEVCNVPEEIWPGLIDSFFDWIDKDNDPRLDGAETEDYYGTIEEPGPYQAKNGPLDTVDELLLVKGFDETILYGEEVKAEYEEDEALPIRGIADFLTTYGDGKVNVNAASIDVLMTLPSMDKLIADKIIEEREGWLDEEGEQEDHSFEGTSDLFARIPDLPPSMRSYVTTGSAVFRITAIGAVHNVKRKVSCIVKFYKEKIIILRWEEG
ncbi:general secretion pathway protein GspK [Verrucomicrobiota bacterium]